MNIQSGLARRIARVRSSLRRNISCARWLSMASPAMLAATSIMRRSRLSGALASA
jgi:hypothetical protein